MGPHSPLLTGSSGRPRAATKRTAPADRKQTRDYRRLPESRAVGRTRGGPSAWVLPPTTQAAAGEHGLRAGVGPPRSNVIHTTAHGAWAVTRRQRAEYGAGTRAIRRGERNEKKRGTHAAEQRRATESNARAPEDASVTHGKMVVETRSKEHHQAEPPARTAQCRALHRPSTQSPTATVHAPPLGADGGRPATQPHRRPP